MDCGGQGLPNGTFRALCPTGHRAHPRLRTAPGTDGRTGSRMTGKGGAPYGDHHQPDQSAVHPRQNMELGMFKMFLLERFGTIFRLKCYFHSIKAYGYADAKGGVGKGP